MGKKLVVKGADFSANAVDVRVIEWYILSYTNYGGTASTPANKANGGWAFISADNINIVGKTINALRFKAEGSGTLNIYRGSLNSSAKSLIGSITITPAESGQVVTKTFTPYLVGANEYLIIGEPNTSAGFYFRDNVLPTDSKNNFYTKVPNTWSLTTNNSLQMCIDVGYIEP